MAIPKDHHYDMVSLMHIQGMTEMTMEAFSWVFTLALCLSALVLPNATSQSSLSPVLSPLWGVCFLPFCFFQNFWCSEEIRTSSSTKKNYHIPVIILCNRGKHPAR